MRARRTRQGLSIVAALLAGTGLVAAANSPFDRRDEAGTVPGAISLGTEPAPVGQTAGEAPVSANPLWGIPLNMLRATRDRPLFRPSRRPPAPAATTPVMAPVKVAPPPVVEETPPLRLVGTVVGPNDGFAVFINNATRNIVRLKTGEGDGGWVLRSVKRREAVLEKNRRTVVLELPSPGGH